MRILFYTSTRADYGILRPLLLGMDDADRLEASLLVTGTHLSGTHGMTVEEIEEDGFAIAARVPIPLASDTWLSTAETMAAGVSAYSTALEQLGPDSVVILGDRFEAFTMAAVCHIARVPVIHLHGGEVTAGALDDSFRHSITKFASLHLVASKEFQTRVVQLGEDPGTVHNVGALGLDALRAELAEYPIRRSSQALITYHPSTLGSEDPVTALRAIVDGTLLSNLESIIITRPNIDVGAGTINALIDEFALNERIEVHASLGAKRYPRTLADSAVVIGNSSSGIIEAPYLGTPTINVGHRQHGRPREKTVIDLTTPTPELVLEAIERARGLLAAPFGPTVYGDGHSVDRCVQLISDFPVPPPTKHFRDADIQC